MSEGVPSFVLKFAVDLIDQKTREATLRGFCADCDLEIVLVFIPDAEIGALLVAPGFPQTLPEGERWHAFLGECLERGTAVGVLPWPTRRTEKKVEAVSADGCVLAAVGENSCNGLLEQLRSILPLIGAAFKGERAALAQAAHAAVAAETAKQAHSLAQGLDKARRDAQREVSLRRKAEEQVRKRNRVLEVLNRTGSILAAEFDLEKVVQLVTNAGAEITGAQFGAFIRKQKNEKSEGMVVQAFAGTDRIAVDALTSAENHDFLSHVLRGDGIIRIDDIGKENPAFIEFNVGKSLRMKSYLAATVSKTGRIFGVLIFGHAEASIFTPDAEEVIGSLAAAGAIAIDNALLYQALQRELEEHKHSEQQLRQAQDELKITNEQLEMRVKERTASLEEAVSQMEEFSYSVSHDLRAPLRAMNAYAEALLQEYGGKLDETAQGYLQRIRRNSLRMEKLTHDVLTYSRVARSEVMVAHVNTERLLDDLIAQYTNLQVPNATIVVERPLADVLAHEVSLGQALTNLLTNSVKFVKPGVHPVIRVRTEVNCKLVRIWIEDNGVGIDPEQHERIFKMFERLNPKAGYDGTGIGLAIVRKAVEKMGGNVGLKSDGECGSQFWIELPNPTPMT
jgi:signal transduction histidine kinase